MSLRRIIAYFVCPALRDELAALRDGNTRVVLENGRLLDKLAERPRGRAGGAKGGRARAASLSPERRSEIASQAAKARWGAPQ